MHDLLIRGGTVVDGTGAAPQRADVAVDNGRITAVGAPDSLGDGARVIDADGRIVTPGFVDIHCHYDGQATWDPVLEPSSLHGITTVIVGNCGVGFAPVTEDKRGWLIELMEGVEDIPGAALSEGISWGWETFPEYLDVLDGFPRAIDIGTQVPHGALRSYVMGERGATEESASPEEIERMGRIVAEAVEAGALGFSTNRLEGHRSRSGIPVPGTYAREDELAGIIGAMGRLGGGTVEWVPNGGVGGFQAGLGGQFDMMRRMCEASERPTIFQVNQRHGKPDRWRADLERVAAMADAGLPAFPQVHGRGFCLLFGFDTSFHPFKYAPTWQPLAALPFEERLEQLRRPQVRAALVAEMNELGDPTQGFLAYDMVFSMGDPPQYEPSSDESMAAIAAAEGRDVLEVIYDHMLANRRPQPAEPADRELRRAQPRRHGRDAAASADRRRWFRRRCALRDGIGRQHAELHAHALGTGSAERAAAAGTCRGEDDERDSEHLRPLGPGVIAPGKKADLNVIDLDGLRLHLPEMRYDLPAGGKRLVQTADGYDATIVSGAVIRRHGVDTGARPGTLVRGAQN